MPQLGAATLLGAPSPEAGADSGTGGVTASGTSSESHSGSTTDSGTGGVTSGGSGSEHFHTGAAEPGMGSASAPRVIDPSYCWARHIVHRKSATAHTREIMPGVFMERTELAGVVVSESGLNGRQGWQHAEATLALEDDGKFTMVLPNVAGEDGKLHRARFRIVTEPNYEPGEEWVELYRDPNDIVFVGTPTDYTITASTVTLTGVDLNGVVAGSLSSEVDQWDAAAPADVLEHYSRLTVLSLAVPELTETTPEGSPKAIEGPVGAFGSPYYVTGYPEEKDCWTAEARFEWKETHAGATRPAAVSSSFVEFRVGETPAELEEWLRVTIDLYDGWVGLGHAPESPIIGRVHGFTMPGPVSIRVVARYEQIFVFVNGELVADWRQTPMKRPYKVAAAVWDGKATVSMNLETLFPFACRGSGGAERKLPGLPTPGGLRFQAWGAPSLSQLSTWPGRLSRLWSVRWEKPTADQLTATADISGVEVLSIPANTPEQFCARWSGAIYLDLEASDRNLQLAATGGLGEVSPARLYVGKTLRGQEYIDNWTSPVAFPSNTGESLRTWLGTSAKGWYPLVIEIANLKPLIVQLKDRAGAGAYGVVPSSRLSPFGTYQNLVRFTGHRQLIGEVAQTFGYQWRTEPRQLESGEFPGQYMFAAVIGRQTDLVLDSSAVDPMVGEPQVQGAATDVVDGLILDAAGLAKTEGAQISAQVIDYARARQHMSLRRVYDSLAEITQANLLHQRADSLVALRGGPNEQVSIRPRGQRDLVDTFPLTGAMARMDWLPGDALRRKLDPIGVNDESPSQLATVTWPLRPDGMGAPTVGFRQRIRNIRQALKKLGATVYGPRRTYQGSIVAMSGGIGGLHWSGAKWDPDGAVDAYSRLALPPEAQVIRVVANVLYLEGTSPWEILIGAAADKLAVPGEGRYDITSLGTGLGSPAQPHGTPPIYVYAWMNSSPANGAYHLQLEAWVSI